MKYRSVLLLMTMLLLSPLNAEAQGAASRVVVLRALLNFRLAILEDTTRFDACSVDEFLGNTHAVDSLPSEYRALLSPRDECTVMTGTRPRILTDSAFVSDFRMTIYTTFIGRGSIYRVEYTGFARTGQVPVITAVRLSDFTQRGHEVLRRGQGENDVSVVPRSNR